MSTGFYTHEQMCYKSIFLDLHNVLINSIAESGYFVVVVVEGRSLIIAHRIARYGYIHLSSSPLS